MSDRAVFDCAVYLQHLEEGKTFRQRFPDLTILDPVAFLGAVRGREQPGIE
jgi:hypothetical protein